MTNKRHARRGWATFGRSFSPSMDVVTSSLTKETHSHKKKAQVFSTFKRAQETFIRATMAVSKPALLLLLAASASLQAGAFVAPRQSHSVLHVSQVRGQTGWANAPRSRGEMSMIAVPPAVTSAVGVAVPAVTSAIGAAVASCGPATAAVRAALLSGRNVAGIAGMTAVSAAAVLPLTLLRQAYSFSVGYGASVAAMAAALISVYGLGNPLTSKAAWASASAPAMLTYSALLYGLRLASFLFVRELTVPVKKEQVKKLDTTKFPPARIPMASAIAMFYAFMATPLLYSLRNAGNLGSPLLAKLQWAGVGLSFAGLLVEAAADQHKYFLKWFYDHTPTFVGPTSGLYSLCRHPNYLGEIMFWAGIYLGGAPAFGRNVAAWTASTLGFWGIVSIMRGATKRLDEKQAEKYADQGAYRFWREDVTAPLFPFVNEKKGNEAAAAET